MRAATCAPAIWLSRSPRVCRSPTWGQDGIAWKYWRDTLPARDGDAVRGVGGHSVNGGAGGFGAYVNGEGVLSNAPSIQDFASNWVLALGYK